MRADVGHRAYFMDSAGLIVIHNCGLSLAGAACYYEMTAFGKELLTAELER